VNGATLRLVLLVSCAHMLVHVYELSISSVEQHVAADFGVDTGETGSLGTIWRIPFGAGALLAGWLADRFGSKPMLVIYLAGCAGSALATWAAPSLGALFGTMFVMGSFASIYHPAGLAIISRETTAAERGRALGWHGIFGSLGSATAPFLAGALLLIPALTWRDYYLVLMVPGAVLAVVIAFALKEHRDETSASASFSLEDGPFHASQYWRLVTVNVLFGFVYAALMTFLPRYLAEADLQPASVGAKQWGALCASVVLLCGMVGQGIAGKLARPDRLRQTMTMILLLNVPCLLAMSLAEGWWRLAAACATGLFHFMHQPVFNSFLAQLVPRRRRSVGYGFSQMMQFGLGGLGALFAGSIKASPLEDPDFVNYLSLAGIALVAASLSSRIRAVPGS
jgi:FSR family fosmidomycin resistance protein-like MFS transporter